MAGSADAGSLVGDADTGVVGGELEEGGADGEHVADVAAEAGDRARERHGQLHLGLVRLHVHDDLVAGDVVADRDLPAHDLRFRHPLAEVGKPEGQRVRHYAFSDASSAATTRAVSGRHQSSTSGHRRGNVVRPATRRIGASSE